MTRLAVVACVFVTGCALLQPPTKEPAPLRPGEILSAQAATQAISVGKSTKADVRTALGEAGVIDFDSGYEVWVYRERLKEKAKPPPTELVLLFPPSGILAKTRIR
ncbi:MAG: hypothetical protein EPO20_27595 [Betaproteobacteria bacterium]|nr:MAG: hypothetical protein EPO20_27595 [Betaproteobacteria bacterium]